MKGSGRKHQAHNPAADRRPATCYLPWNPGFQSRQPRTGEHMSQQGTRIGPYALQVQVGRAASCSVWHAVRADGKARGPSKVAVRLLDDPGDNRAQSRLELEYQRLKAMDGAGAPLAVAHYAGFGALVMEQKQGASLRALVDASLAATLDLDPATALEIALGTARILRHAHQLPAGLVHGRLAPADVLLGRDGTVTLMGWGGWSPQVWSVGIAPEVVRGQAPTASADLFALGALLASALEPRLTHEHGLQAAVHRVLRERPAAGRLLEDLLASEPAARPHDLGTVIHELLSLARHHGGVARVGELADRCGSFRRGGAGARAVMGSNQAPVAPVAPKVLPPITPPPVIPTPAPTPATQQPSTPAPRQPGTPTTRSEPAPPSDSIPAPVPPEPQPVVSTPTPTPTPEPTPEPDPGPTPEETEPERPPAPPDSRQSTGREVGEQADPVEPGGDSPHKPDEPEPSPADGDPYGEDEGEDGEGAQMQLVERVALALVGLLAMALLAWLGRGCIGG
jgi:hypothetical protein